MPQIPVVSSVKCHTSNILTFADHHLKAPAETLKSYIKDTGFYQYNQFSRKQQRHFLSP